jgi:hypothetical protein
MSIAQFDERTPYSEAVAFDDTDTAGDEGSLINSSNSIIRLDVIIATNSGAADVTIGLVYNIGATKYEVGQVVVTAGAGFGGVAPVDVMAAILPAAQQGIVCVPFDEVIIRLHTVPSTGAGVVVVATGGVL